jgi:hypothetical protein
MTLTTKSMITVEEIQQREVDFYNKKFFFSYSSLNRLLWNPASFYQEYILKQKEQKMDKHLIEGKVIHALLLSKSVFDKLFIVMPGKLPGDNTRLIVDHIWKLRLLEDEAYQRPNLSDYTVQINDKLRDINLHQSLVDDKKPDKDGKLRTGDEKRLEKILTYDALEYWDFLQVKRKRDIIDQPTLDFCNSAVDKVRNCPKIMELLGLHIEEFGTTEVLNETEMQYELKSYPFGLKGIIDNHNVDHDNKLITINDVKTSGTNLKDFKDSIEYYNYWIQAVIYVMLVLSQYKHLINTGYKIVFRFIVIDRNHHVYPFRVSDVTMEQWFTKFQTEILFKANYHYTQRQYVLPYEFAEELVVL